MSSVSPLLELRPHYSGFPAVSSPCVLLWKWRRAYNGAVERPLVSSGWTRRTENLRKKCKLWSDAKHGSLGDLAKEQHGGFFWCSPEKLPVGVVAYRRSTLRDLDAVRANGELIFEDGHLNASPAQVFLFLFFFSFLFFFFVLFGKDVVYVPLLDELDTPNRPKLSYVIVKLAIAFDHRGVLSVSTESELARGWQCFHRLRCDFWPHGALPAQYEGPALFSPPLSPLAVNVSMRGLLRGWRCPRWRPGICSRKQFYWMMRSGYFPSRDNGCSVHVPGPDGVPGFTWGKVSRLLS